MGKITVKVRIKEIELEGAQRSVSFEPGLNIITGPIASGKTTLIRYLRFLIGGSLGQQPNEARDNVKMVTGLVELGTEPFKISRPAVSTTTAMVEIAGQHREWRIPASRAPDGNTYKNWLLEQLKLPRIDVPSAPTRPDSDPTPVTINDYLLYSYLAQEELGSSVFSHRDPHKNIKRKYVFDITYGFYELRTAQIQERLRDVQSQIRELSSRQELFNTFFDGTSLSNRETIENDLNVVRDEIEREETNAIDLARNSQTANDTVQIQGEVLDAQQEVSHIQASIDSESQAIGNLEDLVNQLESQSGKLTRSIVSHKHLTDLEFVVCPRCGSGVNSKRSSDDTCYLCLQSPSLEFSREILIAEQGSVDLQLREGQDLLRERELRLKTLLDEKEEANEILNQKRRELDFKTRSYISDEATRIAATAARRAELRSKEEQLTEFLNVLSKIDDAQEVASLLKEEKNALERELESATSDTAESMDKVNFLKQRFNEMLLKLKPPKFGEHELAEINPDTYLPIFYGRSFVEVSSPGLRTLINVSHALAHHLTAVELGLNLPQILIIDGLSEHLGQEGLDPDRLHATYELLIETSEMHPEIQVIVVDNEIPDFARRFVRLNLSEEDRLIRNDDE